MSAALIIILSLLTVYGRCLVPGHGPSWAGTYEAFAHIWVGALFVLCFKADTQLRRKAAITALIAISVFELGMSLLR